MHIGDRIKKLRRELDLTQTDFAVRIGLTQNTVTRYETGDRKPSVSVITLICREFNVNEKWLRTGEGEMFVKKDPEPLDELLSGLLGGENVTDEDRVLIKNFLELSDDSRKEVIKFVQKCAQELSAHATDQAQGDDLASRVAALEKELASEKVRADRAEAEAKARTEELLAVYREDTAEKLPEPVSESVIPSRSR